MSSMSCSSPRPARVTRAKLIEPLGIQPCGAGLPAAGLDLQAGLLLAGAGPGQPHAQSPRPGTPTRAGSPKGRRRELANGRNSYDTPWSPDAISFWQGIPGINPVHGHRAAVSSGRAVLAAHGSLEGSGVCHLRIERGCVLLTRGCHRQRSIARPDVGWGMPYP
jgi:hypothetical protein